MLALTATATEDVVDDIRSQLYLHDAEVVHTGFYRPNLRLETIRVEGEEGKRAELLRLLRESEGTGIVYTATVKGVTELVSFLAEQGVAVEPYHGRLRASERSENQDRFMRGERKAIVATNAFGMGIDKPDIRFVIHHHLPSTLEAYYQEAGRAGRDELPARCTLLFDPIDKRLHSFFQAGRHPVPEDLVNAHHALKRLSDAPDPPTFAELQAISPVGKSRLKPILNLFKKRGILKESPEGRLILLHAETTPDDLERMARAYRERDERDRDKQQRMLSYADLRACRWDSLVNYFGKDDVEADSCGHCDRCTPESFVKKTI